MVTFKMWRFKMKCGSNLSVVVALICEEGTATKVFAKHEHLILSAC